MRLKTAQNILLAVLFLAPAGCVESAPSTSNAETSDAGTTNADANANANANVVPGERTLVLRVAKTLEVLVEEPVEVVVIETDGSETPVAAQDYTVAAVTGAEFLEGNLLAEKPGSGEISVEYDGLTATEKFEVTFEPQRVTVSLDVACVSTKRGRVWCWGTNENGELGRGEFSNSPDQTFTLGPALHPFDAPVVDVDCGLNACFAVTEAGSIYSWGSREDNRLGRTSNTFENPTPTLVELNNFHAVEVHFEESHGCALDRDNQFACWGNNSRGQLGDGGRNNRTITVVDNVLAHAIDVGDDATCFIEATSKSIRCAGSSAWLPSTGDDLLEFTAMTVPPQLDTEAKAIGVGDQHFCALAGADIWCAGEQRAYEGPDTNFNISLGAKVDLPAVEGTVQQIISADDINFVQTDNGNWHSFGENERGVAGTQDQISDYDGPRVQAPANADIRWIATASENTCIITESSRIFCVGNDNTGLLGPDASATSETWVEILPPWE